MNDILVFNENLISNYHHEPQEAFVWFLIIPFLLLSGILVYNKLKGDSMAIIGVPFAGKTTILRYMQGHEFDSSYKPSQNEAYKKFDLSVGDRTIKAGIDYGGGEEWVKDHYPAMIKESDILIFVFNADSFIKDGRYRRMTLARLDFVFEQIKIQKENLFFNLDNFIENHFALIGSHADHIKDEPKSVIQKLQKDYQNKDYRKVFQHNFAILDLTQKDELFNFTKDIF